ncbi:MAG: hypothetical protein ACYC3H_00070 [Bellilinea sp.]
MITLRRNLFRHLGVLLFYAVLTVIFTFPLALHLTDSVLGGRGDNLYFVWLTGWYEQAFFDGGGHPFFSPVMNWPEGWNLSTTDTALASVLPGAFLSKFFGPIAGYNLAMMLTFVLSGWAMYVWVRHLTKSEGAALLAGAIFAFLPYRMAHFLIGHLNLSGTQWFPLYFMGLLGMLRTEARGWWQPAVLAAVSLGLIGFTSMYYLYMGLIITFVFILAYLIFSGFKILKQPSFWKQIGIFVVLAIPMVYASVRYFMSLSSSGTIASRDWHYASMYSASPTDFILPSTDHFLFGQWVGSHFNRDLWPEATLYVGFIALALLVIAIIHRKQTGQPGLVWAATTTAISAFILALGTDLHWNAEQVIVQVPAFLQPLVGKSETPLLLPTYWLFNHLPFFDRMRALSRFGLFTGIFTTLLAGLGAAVLLAHLHGRRKTLAAVVLMLAVLLDFYPGSYAGSLTQIEPRPLDTWLASQPGDGAVAMFPFEQVEEQFNIYTTLIHNKPFIGGLFNANQPPQYTYIKPTMEHFPSPKSIDKLKELGITYVVVDTSAFADYPEVEAEIVRNGLRLLTEQKQYRVYGFEE